MYYVATTQTQTSQNAYLFTPVVVVETDGSAAGTSTADAVSSALWQCDGAASGTGAASGAGVALWNTLASASGTSTVSGDIQSAHPVTKITQLDLSAAIAQRYASFVGKPNISASDGSASGTGTASGVGVAYWLADASASGTSTVDGVTVVVAPTVASSDGTSTVTGNTAWRFAVVAGAFGTGSATADGENAGGGGAPTAAEAYSYRRRGRR